MNRDRINTCRIAGAAVAIVDDRGYDALSLSSVAERLGVVPSALYTHVTGLDGLRRLVSASAADNMAAEVRTAAIGVTGPEAVRSVSCAYRDFARAHPGQFSFTIMPRTGANTAADADADADADDEILNVFEIVYRCAGLGRGESARAARTTRSAVHGFVTMEIVTGPARDDHFVELVETMAAVIAR